MLQILWRNFISRQYRVLSPLTCYSISIQRYQCIVAYFLNLYFAKKIEREIYIAVFQEALIDPHIFFLSEEVLMIDKYLAKELLVSIDDNLQALFRVSVPQRHCRAA